MLKNLTISEFEAMVTTRVLAGSRMRDRRTGAFRSEYPYNEILATATYAANDVLKEIGANRDLWCMMRGRRTYIFHMQTKRIAGELGIVTDNAENGYRKRFRAIVLDRRGYTKQPTLGDLIVTADRLGPRRFKRNNHANHLEIKKAMERRAK